jgi:hypothetical protein
MPVLTTSVFICWFLPETPICWGLGLIDVKMRICPRVLFRHLQFPGVNSPDYLHRQLANALSCKSREIYGGSLNASRVIWSRVQLLAP